MEGVVIRVDPSGVDVAGNAATKYIATADVQRIVTPHTWK